MSDDNHDYQSDSDSEEHNADEAQKENNNRDHGNLIFNIDTKTFIFNCPDTHCIRRF